MKLNIDPEWLRKKAEQDNGQCISVGGLYMRAIDEQIEALRRAVQFGLDNGKHNLIVDLHVLAAALNLTTAPAIAPSADTATYPPIPLNETVVIVGCGVGATGVKVEWPEEGT